MFLRTSPAILLLSGGLLLAGCADVEGPRLGEGAGTVLGATAGGLVGSRIGAGTGAIAATGAGLLIGALAGNEIGRALYPGPRTALVTPTDRTLASLPSNRPLPPATAAPVPGTAGANCREYQQTITVGGEERPGYGTACQQPDGSWKIVR